MHTLAQLAGERLFHAMGKSQVHNVFFVADLVTDGARIRPIEAKEYSQQTEMPIDPQGEPSVHVQLRSAITVYGDYVGDKPRFALFHGAFEAGECAKMMDEGQDFHALGKRWDHQWVLPGMANALRRIVLLEWQALGRAPKHDWAQSPDSSQGRVARLAFAAYVFEVLDVGALSYPNVLSPYLFRMGAGLELPAFARGIFDEEPEEGWDRVSKLYTMPGETWSFKQVQHVVHYSHRQPVQVPNQFVPLEHLTDPILRSMSLMQALAYLLCEFDKGPRIEPTSAATWLMVPPSQVRTHLSRARAKLARLDSARKAPTGAPTNSGPAEAGKGGDQIAKSSGGKSGGKSGGGRPHNGPSTTGNKSGGGRGNNPSGK